MLNALALGLLAVAQSSSPTAPFAPPKGPFAVGTLDRTPGHLFYKRLDLSRIGMMGWSFGGATAMQMSRNDPRVKALVDQDGQLFGDVRDKGTSVRLC
jgi:hypothetical protein